MLFLEQVVRWCALQFIAKSSSSKVMALLHYRENFLRRALLSAAVLITSLSVDGSGGDAKPHIK
jgi:hypothetical protein